MSFFEVDSKKSSSAAKQSREIYREIAPQFLETEKKKKEKKRKEKRILKFLVFE